MHSCRCCFMCLPCFPETMHVARLIIISPSVKPCQAMSSSHLPFMPARHGRQHRLDFEPRVAHVIPSHALTSSHHVRTQRPFLARRASPRFGCTRVDGLCCLWLIGDPARRGEAARRWWPAVVVVTADPKHRDPPETLLPPCPHSLIQPPHLYQHLTCHVTSRLAHYETTANARATTFRHTTYTSGFASA